MPAMKNKGIETLITKAFGLIVTIFTLSMVGMVFTNAVLRYAFRTGIPEAEELSRYLFIWLCFLGTIAAFRDGQHVGVDMFVNMMPPKVKKYVVLTGQCITMAVFAIMFIGGIAYMKTGGASEGPSTGIPFGYMSVAICVASVAMAAILVRQMMLTWRGPAGKEVD
jgi:TRAP-type C4-dicarboxylate transport system permease small subunit